MLDILLSQGVLDDHLDLAACLRLSEVSKTHAGLITQLTNDKIRTILPSMSSSQRDTYYGLIDVFQPLPSHIVQGMARSGNDIVTVFEKAATLRAKRVETFDDFQLSVDTMSMNLLRPLWKARLPVLLAGGSVLRALHGGFLNTEHAEWDGDFDLWLTVPQDEVIATAERVLTTWQESGMCGVYLDGYQDQTPTFVNGSLTVSADCHHLKCCLLVHSTNCGSGCKFKFDIILRSYFSTTAVISRFDLDCSRFAYNGYSVLTTVSGIAALQTGVNTLSVSDVRKIASRRTVVRMGKYAARGFSTRFLEATDLVSVRSGESHACDLLREVFTANRRAEQHNLQNLAWFYQSCLSHRYNVFYGSFASSKVNSFVEWAVQTDG